MKRYTQWHHLRLNGNEVIARQYLGEGRKYLGYAVEELAKGATQQTYHFTNADGIKFTVILAGEQPILIIDAPGPGDKPLEPITFEGFIGRPSPASDQNANTDKNHVLLRPGPDGWVPFFFDDAHRPGEPLDDARLYGEFFPNGIGAYGNVDWRSADQSVFISWMGPSCRYAGFASGFFGTSSYVYMRGQTILDVSDADTIEALELVEPVSVRGACLRMIAGQTWLYVALKGEDEPDGQYLARWRMISPALQQKAAGRYDVPVHMFADAVADPGSAELLLSVAYNDGSYGTHPFMFNSSGTAARRIFTLSGTVYETFLFEDEETEAWVLDVTETSYSRTDTIDRVRTTHSGGVYVGDYLYGETGDSVSASDTKAHPWYLNPLSELVETGNVELVNSTITHTFDSTAEKAKVGVDFWDGEWRYAYAYFRNNQAISDKQMTSDILYSMYDHNFNDTGAGPDEVVRDEVVDGTITYEATEVNAGVLGGLNTDFLDLPLATQHNLVGEWSYEYHRAQHLDVVLETDERSRVIQLETAYTTVSQQMSLYYLDLRFGVASYKLRTTTAVGAWDGDVEGTQSYDQPTTSYSSTGIGTIHSVGDLPLTGNITTTITTQIRVLVNGTEVLEDSEDVVSLDPVAMDMPAPNWVHHFYDNAAPVLAGYDEDGAIIANHLGLQWATNAGPSNTWAWHCTHGATNGGGVTSPDYQASEWETTATTGVTPVLPSADSVVDYSDFAASAVAGTGSWITVKNAWIVDQNNPDTRPSTLDDRSILSSHVGLDGILSLIPDAVRYFPVSYLCKTIALKPN